MTHGMFTQLRGAAALLLTDTGQPLTGAVVGDGGGGGTTTWTAGSTVPCRVDSLTGTEGVIGDRISERSTHTITVPPNVSVDESDRFVISGRGTFEITAIQAHTDDPLLLLEATQV